MQLKELINKTDMTLYNYLQGQSLKVHQSKQKELLQIINGQTKLENITSDKINSYIEHLQNKNNSNKTINAKLSYIRNILRYAHNMGWTKSIPLNKHLQELTQEWQEYTINYMQIQYLFKKMLKEINILDADATIHKIRHTFCSRLVEKGVPLPVIQKLAGHKKITTTMLYMHVKDEQLEKAVALL